MSREEAETAENENNWAAEEEEEEQCRLYEAYNELHGLAQAFDTPFDAPAVLVVGHQTDGKSALVEALMGFQFNHVGGGTKTRRPITLHMKYDPHAHSPVCHLLLPSDSNSDYEKPLSLQEIQAYIEAENMRLEKEPCLFSSKEIIIRVEYKYCPNLTIIDTPGLIAPAPGPKNRALQGQARAVEALVRLKMQHKEFIILCLEDCSDWSNATTRRVVMQIDPELSRTVIVSTKLDTKIPQFSRASDVEVFLSPPTCMLDGCILGDSPFFTSVPSGRVGVGQDSVYRSNDEFKKAISLREMEDVASLEEKMGRSLSMQERSRLGVSKLRSFLEELLQKRYMDNVPLIIPLLEKEFRSATRKMNEINQELSTLDELKLKEKGRIFHDLFLTKNRAGLRQFLDSFAGTEHATTGGSGASAGLSQDSSFGSVTSEKETKSRGDVKLSHVASGTDLTSSIHSTETRLADLLDSTLWNRRLAPSSERIVYALVQQIFHGIKEYFLASAELKFNCFLLMPVVDKLPALLREDLKSAFEDDLDNIFDITNLRHLLGQQKRDAEIEIKRIKRLKDKFRSLHKQLSSNQAIATAFS